MGVTVKKCHTIMSGNDCWNSVFRLMPESRQRIGWRDIVGQTVLELCYCDRKRSTAGGWQFERQNPQTVRSSRAEWWSTRHVYYA